jgi:DNA modification methylase
MSVYYNEIDRNAAAWLRSIACEIHLGDCIESMKLMPEKSVHTCVTSPPYFGLRDYGVDGQIGLEDTPEAFVARLVDVFREVRRVLRDDGTLWLNLGDSYAAQRGGTHQPAETLAGGRNGISKDGNRVNRSRHDGYNPTRNASAIGLKHKDLIGIPWRVAFALQADGWYLRQDIIWHKPNPMPESVTDRCTKAHEYVFLLSKGPRYYFDAEAIKEPAVKGAAGSTFHKGKTAAHQAGRASEKDRVNDGTRNRRSVWTVTTKPYKGAHFATFPPDLIEPCILAGSPRGGVVLDPFGGSGTTAGVAIKNGRKAVLCELNPEYTALVPARITAIAGGTANMFRGAV